MTIKQLIRRLAQNFVTFTSQGEKAKADACLAAIEAIYANGYENLRGKIEIQAPAETA